MTKARHLTNTIPWEISYWSQTAVDKRARMWARDVLKSTRNSTAFQYSISSATIGTIIDRDATGYLKVELTDCITEAADSPISHVKYI